MTGARMAFMFFWLYYFSFFGMLGALFGYEFFHATNPNGLQGIFFLMFAGAALFFGFQALKAFTDPLPTWLDYWLTPAHYAPMTDRQKRGLFKVYAFTCVLFMSGGILFFVALHGFTLERIALPVGMGLLAFLVLLFFLDVVRAIYLFRKDRKAPNPPNLTAKSG